MRVLFVIPARKGSKGVPGKNTKLLGGKPLVQYSIEMALSLASPKDICVTTDSEDVIAIAKNQGLDIPFIRPQELSGDTASSRAVILHAIEYYKNKGVMYDALVLLQPTSPFRKKNDIQEMLASYNDETDLVVSVKECHDNPYFSQFEESSDGYLQLVKTGHYTRRQDCPKVYAYNGSVYVMRISTLEKMEIQSFPRTKKYLMDEIHSLDIDTPFDWAMAEMFIEKKLFS